MADNNEDFYDKLVDIDAKIDDNGFIYYRLYGNTYKYGLVTEVNKKGDTVNAITKETF
jgi:hypothetical protein